MSGNCCAKKENCCEEDHHHHHHDGHGHFGGAVLRIVAAVCLLVAAVVVEKCLQLAVWQLLLIYLVPYLVIGFPTLKEAVEGLLHGEAFNEHFLMSVATLGALSIGFLPGAEPEFVEAVAVMLLFNVGELFEGFAEGRSRDSISHLMDIRPDIANVLREGTEFSVSPAEVEVGEVVVVKPGEKVPLDGVIVEGYTAVNTVALTGESVPRELVEGDEIFSGCINISGVVKVRTIRSYGESAVSRIIGLVENAKENKSNSEGFISRFARIYTPVVVFSAVALAVLPPLFSGDFVGSFSVWLYRALMFLIVSCPCAFVISVPLTFFGGIGGASRKGILIKGSAYFDILAKVGTVVFDKTGTLTYGQFAVTAVHPEKFDERRLLHLAAHVEHFSTHPIGAALRDAFPDEATDGCVVSNVVE
ncbi:MAG: HAD-IC family P-type ATPase, partial [Bacteroidales bacterium]|nr:HAD-IC family P-type ATPase [Bacteroidales bacterium]